MAKKKICDSNVLRKNTRKSDDTFGSTTGSSLAMGTKAYNERVLDLKDISDETCEDILKDDYKEDVLFSENAKESSFRKHYKDSVSNFVNGIRDKESVRNYGILTPTERQVSHEVRKRIASHDLEELSITRARETETLEDDLFVEKELPDLLDKGVYDEGKLEDDFLPGSQIFNKYL